MRCIAELCSWPGGVTQLVENLSKGVGSLCRRGIRLQAATASGAHARVLHVGQ